MAYDLFISLGIGRATAGVICLFVCFLWVKEAENHNFIWELPSADERR